MDPIQELLTDPIRQRDRYANLRATAQGLCDHLNRSAQEQMDDSTPFFLVDDGRMQRMFDLYMRRLATFKERMEMNNSRINDEKIAALCVVCIMDENPIVSHYGPKPDIVHNYYRNAWYCIHVVANFLDIDLKRLRGQLRADVLNFIRHLEFVREILTVTDTSATEAADCDAYIRRFQFCLCLVELLRTAFPLPTQYG